MNYVPIVQGTKAQAHEWPAHSFRVNKLQDQCIKSLDSIQWLLQYASSPDRSSVPLTWAQIDKQTKTPLIWSMEDLVLNYV